MDHWQVQCKTVIQRNSHILETGYRSDCTFQVGSSEWKLIKAHKVILASASPVFDAMIYGDMAETMQEIKVEDVEPEAFHALLRYVYTESADIKSVEAAFLVYYAADKYILPGLKEDCIQYIMNSLSPGNVCGAYEFAKFFERTDLMTRCMDMISEDTEVVLEDENFMAAEMQTVVDIFTLPAMNLSSEILLLKAAEKYCESQEEDTPVLSDTPTTSPSIMQAIHQIRFLTISPQQFADQVYKCPLLDKAVKCDLLMGISFPECGAAVPDGFCTTRETRIPKTLTVLTGTKHCYLQLQSEGQKLEALEKLCGFFYYSVILCDQRKDMEKVREILQERGRPVDIIHQDMNQLDVYAIIQQYYESCIHLIATASMATDFDMTRIGFVINFDFPLRLGDYRYASARGCEPITVNFITAEQLKHIRHIERYYCVKMKDIPYIGNIGQAVRNYRDSKL